MILPCNFANFKKYEAISCFNECSTRREKNVKFVQLLVYASAIEKKSQLNATDVWACKK